MRGPPVPVVLICVALFGMPAVAGASSSVSGDDADRLALANRYFMVTHREEREREIIERSLGSSITFCKARPCQKDLAEAIHATAVEIAPLRVREFAELYARRFSADQLRALIDFDSSPVGQSILKTREAMAEEEAQTSHRSVELQLKSLWLRFCPGHRDICGSTPLPGKVAGATTSSD